MMAKRPSGFCARQPNVLILDLLLPKLDGLSVLKEASALPKPPIGLVLTNAMTDFAAQAAEKVAALIDAIGDVSLESEAAIREAREAYNALDEQAKEFVANADALTAAEAAYCEQKAAEKEKTIAQLLKKMRVEDDRFQGATFYYHSSTPQNVGTRTHIIPGITRSIPAIPIFSGLWIIPETTGCFGML